MLKRIFPPTTKRVACHTKCDINSDIKDETIKCINLYKNAGTQLFSDKINKLNAEWDTERVVETKAGCVILISSIMGLKSNKAWFIITGLAGIFLMKHALIGCCPTDNILRKMGIRTSEEIHNEKTVLKILRGDFSDANTANADAAQLLEIAEK